MPITPKRMPFLDHIAELRWRLLIIAVSVATLSLVTYPFAWKMMDLLVWPIHDLLPNGGKLVLSGPFQGFTFRFKLSMWGALVLSSPVIIWQVMAFFVPALKPKERKWFLPTVIALVVLFVAGLSFCYFVILHPAFSWMNGQLEGSVVSNIGFADLWLGGVSLLMLAFGVSFEVPVVVFYLIAFNIVPYKKFREMWRYVYVGLAIFAAVATPDWSPVTMGSLFFALLLMYEASLFLARLVFIRRERALALSEEE